MTREEAARILEYPVFKWSLDWDDREDGLEYSEAIQMAIAALRAQPAKLDRSRWKGCSFCELSCTNCIYCPGKCDDCTNFSKFSRRFSGIYCRECGLPLTEDAWADLERRIGGNDETD